MESVNENAPLRRSFPYVLTTPSHRPIDESGQKAIRLGMHMDTKALFTQRFDAARAALAEGNEAAAAESLHWAIVAARSDSSLRRELASALFHLGKLSRKFGRAGEAEAEGLLTEALTISEALFGTKDAALGPVLNELSRLYLQQSQHARAEQALDRLLAIARVRGEEHPDVAAALAALAFVKRKRGNDASAEALYRDALRIREKVLEPDHTVTVGTLEQLSETCAAQGNFVEALALLHRALPVREVTLGPGHERVRALRSRVSKLELEIAIAADTAAAAAARASREVTPTPIWLKPVSDTPADSPSTAAPSPVHSKALEFLGDSEPRAIRPSSRPRDRSMTPTVAVAVAAASLMVTSIPTPSASQIAIPAAETARPVGGRESGAMHRDLVLVDVVRSIVEQEDAASVTAFDDRRSAVAAAQGDSPARSRKKSPLLYASIGMAAVAIAVAGLLMSRPHAGGGKDPVSTDMSVAQSGNAANTSTAMTPATQIASTASAAAVAPAMAVTTVAATRADSARSAAATPAHNTAAVVHPEKAESEPAPPELRAPSVDIHVASIAMPNVPSVINADSILRSATERQRAPEGERFASRNDALNATANGDVARTSPKVIGNIPQPNFPDALLRAGSREGQVTVRFMVNEQGRVDPATMVVEQSDNDLFTNAVRDILPLFRFEPAHLRTAEWKPVSAWVSLPFRFTTKKK
jgi:TonB family protein